uniref:Uncharacterized protein n=1 Tax=Chromera velia CCMP2878 TaxID=1169474 RepID=A0A0G4H238_9ALVE|eukprot:Cvel_5583.t1-p1 / transcript=Cvel_5583.t1 / gene=Cvel_5583 / organism=Chromera_velia_CCMP2878 / gene_product=hypothetical protein / transcript_product=hypothetical protein / location=Cvel_scaffold262:76632-85147(+) / protein_length=1759 / sequence_SO=supercontig / SO=protein_coding / is_pseudo=false
MWGFGTPKSSGGGPPKTAQTPPPPQTGGQAHSTSSRPPATSPFTPQALSTPFAPKTGTSSRPPSSTSPYRATPPAGSSLIDRLKNVKPATPPRGRGTPSQTPADRGSGYTDEGGPVRSSPLEHLNSMQPDDSRSSSFAKSTNFSQSPPTLPHSQPTVSSPFGSAQQAPPAIPSHPPPPKHMAGPAPAVPVPGSSPSASAPSGSAHPPPIVQRNPPPSATLASSSSSLPPARQQQTSDRGGGSTTRSGMGTGVAVPGDGTTGTDAGREQAETGNGAVSGTRGDVGGASSSPSSPSVSSHCSFHSSSSLPPPRENVQPATTAVVESNAVTVTGSVGGEGEDKTGVRGDRASSVAPSQTDQALPVSPPLSAVYPPARLPASATPAAGAGVGALAGGSSSSIASSSPSSHIDPAHATPSPKQKPTPVSGSRPPPIVQSPSSSSLRSAALSRRFATSTRSLNQSLAFSEGAAGKIGMRIPFCTAGTSAFGPGRSPFTSRPPHPHQRIPYSTARSAHAVVSDRGGLRTGGGGETVRSHAPSPYAGTASPSSVATPVNASGAPPLSPMHLPPPPTSAQKEKDATPGERERRLSGAQSPGGTSQDLFPGGDTNRKSEAVTPIVHPCASSRSYVAASMAKTPKAPTPSNPIPGAQSTPHPQAPPLPPGGPSASPKSKTPIHHHQHFPSGSPQSSSGAKVAHAFPTGDSASASSNASGSGGTDGHAAGSAGCVTPIPRGPPNTTGARGGIAVASPGFSASPQVDRGLGDSPFASPYNSFQSPDPVSLTGRAGPPRTQQAPRGYVGGDEREARTPSFSPSAVTPQQRTKAPGEIGGPTAPPTVFQTARPFLPPAGRRGGRGLGSLVEEEEEGCDRRGEGESRLRDLVALLRNRVSSLGTEEEDSGRSPGPGSRRHSLSLLVTPPGSSALSADSSRLQRLWHRVWEKAHSMVSASGSSFEVPPPPQTERLLPNTLLSMAEQLLSGNFEGGEKPCVVETRLSSAVVASAAAELLSGFEAVGLLSSGVVEKEKGESAVREVEDRIVGCLEIVGGQLSFLLGSFFLLAGRVQEVGTEKQGLQEEAQRAKEALRSAKEERKRQEGRLRERDNEAEQREEELAEARKRAEDLEHQLKRAEQMRKENEAKLRENLKKEEDLRKEAEEKNKKYARTFVEMKKQYADMSERFQNLVESQARARRDETPPATPFPRTPDAAAAAGAAAAATGGSVGGPTPSLVAPPTGTHPMDRTPPPTHPSQMTAPQSPSSPSFSPPLGRRPSETVSLGGGQRECNGTPVPREAQRAVEGAQGAEDEEEHRRSPVRTGLLFPPRTQKQNDERGTPTPFPATEETPPPPSHPPIRGPGGGIVLPPSEDLGMIPLVSAGVVPIPPGAFRGPYSLPQAPFSTFTPPPRMGGEEDPNSLAPPSAASHPGTNANRAPPKKTAEGEMVVLGLSGKQCAFLKDAHGWLMRAVAAAEAEVDKKLTEKAQSTDGSVVYIPRLNELGHLALEMVIMALLSLESIPSVCTWTSQEGKPKMVDRMAEMETKVHQGGLVKPPEQTSVMPAGDFSRTPQRDREGGVHIVQMDRASPGPSGRRSSSLDPPPHCVSCACSVLPQVSAKVRRLVSDEDCEEDETELEGEEGRTGAFAWQKWPSMAEVSQLVEGLCALMLLIAIGLYLWIKIDRGEMTVEDIRRFLWGGVEKGFVALESAGHSMVERCVRLWRGGEGSGWGDLFSSSSASSGSFFSLLSPLKSILPSVDSCLSWILEGLRVREWLSG